MLSWLLALNPKNILAVIGAAVLAVALLFAYTKGYEAAKYKAEAAQLRQVELAMKADNERRDKLAEQDKKDAESYASETANYKEKVSELLKQIEDGSTIQPQPKQPTERVVIVSQFPGRNIPSAGSSRLAIAALTAMLLSGCVSSGDTLNPQPVKPDPIPADIALCFKYVTPAPKGALDTKGVVKLVTDLHYSEVNKNHCGKVLIRQYESYR